LNTVTPRIFIAATEQDTGKTTVSLGLYKALEERFAQIGYIKPVGQRFTKVDGRRIDDDSILIQTIFGTRIPIEHMSPIAVEPDFTRRYINHSTHDTLVKRIRNSFDRSSWEKEFTIIEGSGHAGVGSVFDLSNATVARLLHSKVVLVVPGGIGKPVDEAALSKALFDREGVEVVGVVMNKVLEEKIDTVTSFARRGFERLGLELLGVMPLQKSLTVPSLEQISRKINGTFVANPSLGRNLALEHMIGAPGSGNVFRKLAPGTLLITPGDREDILLAAIEEASAPCGGRLAGLVLSDDLHPHPSLIDRLCKTTLPVVLSSLDCYTIARRIHSLKIKVEPADAAKIRSIQDLVAKHVDISRILEKAGC